MRYGVFLSLVLVGDDRDVTCINGWMQFQRILPELPPVAGVLITNNNSNVTH
jgi:hypothetical protein